MSSFPTPRGQVGGHEGVGKVIAYGTDLPGPGPTGISCVPAIGSYVGIKYSASACLSCKYCLLGAETSCVNGTVSGFYSPGTFQQYVIAPANYVTPIPESVVNGGEKGEEELAGYAPLMCGGVTVYTALRRAGAKVGDWVLVSGAGGGLGHLAVQYARALGCRVVGIDHPSKEAIVKEIGADVYVDFTKFDGDEELVKYVKAVTGGGGVKIALGCSSSHKAYKQAVNMLDVRGVLVCMGVPEGDDVPMQGAKIALMVQKELTMFAIKAGNRLEAVEAVAVAAAGKVKTRYQLRRMDELTSVFGEMERGKINGRVVIDLR
jgi:alcohol dehydrogenase, propanol-preferring